MKVFTLDIVTPEEWATFSESAHAVVFDKLRPKSHDRITFAVIAMGERHTPLGYTTVRELDHESCYWQFGGCVPDVRGTVTVHRIYASLIDLMRRRCYRRVTTYVESENIGYLKLAMTHGFRVVGCRMFEGQVLVELYLDLYKGED